MIFERFYNDYLAQASFMLGCPATGEAIIIDPTRDCELYIEAASKAGLKISAVTETHIHADYLSGSRELSAVTGAKLYLSDEGDADWKYTFSNERNVILLRHGDTIRAGAVKLTAIRTPGHTPEHLSFILTDEAAGPAPLGAFTGDFLFAGDVGRPDLLEKAANIKGTMEIGAKTLYKSISEFKKSYPPHLLLWPGHGAGSACGKSLGAVPVSTLGYEAMVNWAFKISDEQSFVTEVLSDQPDPPSYFAEMKIRNKKGPAIRGKRAELELLSKGFFEDTLEEKGWIIDIRATSYVEKHFRPGTIHIPLQKQFVTWAGWIMPYDTNFFILTENRSSAEEAKRALELIGLDNCAGWFKADEVLDEKSESIVSLSVNEFVSAGAYPVIDVRNTSEFQKEHIPNAVNIPIGKILAQLGLVPSHEETVVQCGGGTRSVIAITLLKREGFDNLINLTGGFSAYKEARGACLK